MCCITSATGRPTTPSCGSGLARGGRSIIVVDFHERTESRGLPRAMRLADSEVIAEFDRAGFQLARRWNFRPRQCVLEFR